MASMTSKERILAAIRCEEVDRVPMILIFWESPRHPMAEWETERGRLERFRRWGWDTRVRMLTQVSPSEDVRVETGYERDGETIVLRQVWRTPAGTLEERLKVSDDWDEACGKTGFILGPGVGIRHDWPRENIEACSRAWKRLR